MASLALSLLRHAKSSWADADTSDHERPLAPRGIKAANRMSRYLDENGLVPDLVLVSDAVRTQATAALLFTPLKAAAPEIVSTGNLYLADPDQILEVVRHAAADRAASPPHHIMVIAHNPGLQHLALELPKHGRRRDIERIARKFPTAALAHFVWDGSDWSSLVPGEARLERFITPKSLKD